MENGRDPMAEPDEQRYGAIEARIAERGAASAPEPPEPYHETPASETEQRLAALEAQLSAALSERDGRDVDVRLVGLPQRMEEVLGDLSRLGDSLRSDVASLQEHVDDEEKHKQKQLYATYQGPPDEPMIVHVDIPDGEQSVPTTISVKFGGIGDFRLYNFLAATGPVTPAVSDFGTGDNEYLALVRFNDAAGVPVLKYAVLSGFASSSHTHAMPTVATRWYDVLGIRYVTSEPSDEDACSLMAGKAWMSILTVSDTTLIISNYQRCVKLVNTAPYPWTGTVAIVSGSGTESEMSVDNGVPEDGTLVGIDPNTGDPVELNVTAGVVETYAGQISMINASNGEAVIFTVVDGRLRAQP